jgi:HSP20 family protein
MVAPSKGFAHPASRRLLADPKAWPRVDVAETEKEVKVTAELPGINEAEVDVRVSDGI